MNQEQAHQAMRLGNVPNFSASLLAGKPPLPQFWCTTAMPAQPHLPPPIYIAQPININLEVNPKIHIPTIAPTVAICGSVMDGSGASQVVTSMSTASPSMTITDRVEPPMQCRQAQHNQNRTAASSQHPCPGLASGSNGVGVRPPAVLGLEGTGDCWNTAVSGWEEATLIKNKIGLVVNQRYKILQSIASGSYGAIFVGEDLWSESKRRIAVKFDAACRDDHLKYEFDVYKSVLYDDGTGKVEGFPRVYWYGHEYGHNILVMELLGAPLASLFAFCDRRFGKKTIIALGIQMIERLRHLHRRGFIHRDIKPENFLMGLGEQENTCYLIDFGLARRYRFRENRDLRHIPFRRNRSFVGTAKYASLNSHKGLELSRRDDLESLGYVIIELINGNLPWKHISKRNTAYTRQQTSTKIRMIKEQTPWAEICPSMAKFISYCRRLPFLDDPDYDVMLELVRAIDFVERPEYVPRPLANKIRCESCSAVLRGSSAAIIMRPEPLPTTSLQPPTHLVGVLDDSSNVGGNSVMSLLPPAIPTGNVLCQIPFTLIKPVEDCMASLRSLSIAAAAVATSVNAAAAGPASSLTSFNCIPADATAVVIPPDPVTSTTIVAEETEEEEDENDSEDLMTSCRRCRQRLARQRIYSHDGEELEKCHATVFKNSTNIVEFREVEVCADGPSGYSYEEEEKSTDSLPCPRKIDEPMPSPGPSTTIATAQCKMSWQVWRESTLDRRFQYENRFSWTLARKSKGSPQKAAGLLGRSTRYQPHFTLDGIEYDMSIPPPSLPVNNCMLETTKRRRAKASLKFAAAQSVEGPSEIPLMTPASTGPTIKSSPVPLPQMPALISGGPQMIRALGRRLPPSQSNVPPMVESISQPCQPLNRFILPLYPHQQVHHPPLLPTVDVTSPHQIQSIPINHSAHFSGILLGQPMVTGSVSANATGQFLPAVFSQPPPSPIRLPNYAHSSLAPGPLIYHQLPPSFRPTMISASSTMPPTVVNPSPR